MSTVQMLWVEGPLSTVERLAMVSFLKNGHPVHLYTYGEIPNIPEGVERRDARDVVTQQEMDKLAHAPGVFSDVFRYKLLLDRGGIYCDTDVVCVRPLDFAPKKQQFFATERIHPQPGQKQTFGVTPCMMKAPAGSKLMEEALARARKILSTPGSDWGETGPVTITALVNKYNLGSDTLPPDAFCPIAYWDFMALVSGPGALFGHTWGIHFYNEFWRRNFVDKNGTYDPLCLFERLKRHYLG